MKVICINNRGQKFVLTKDKIYEVKVVDADMYILVEDDEGNSVPYSSARFQKIQKKEIVE